jgi:hypothetical protein
LGQVFNFRSGCMHTMHLLPSVAMQPNLKLKTRPKQLLGSLPLVIVLSAENDQHIFNILNLLVWAKKPFKKSLSNLNHGYLGSDEHMVMPWFCFVFALVQHVAPLCLQWPLAQPLPAAWAVVWVSLFFFGVCGWLTLTAISYDRNFLQFSPQNV